MEHAVPDVSATSGPFVDVLLFPRVAVAITCQTTLPDAGTLSDWVPNQVDELTSRIMLVSPVPAGAPELSNISQTAIADDTPSVSKISAAKVTLHAPKDPSSVDGLETRLVISGSATGVGVGVGNMDGATRAKNEVGVGLGVGVAVGDAIVVVDVLVVVTAGGAGGGGGG